MCGRFFVDEETAREIEKVIHNVDLQIQRMRTGDIFPSQPAGILTQCGKRREQPAAIASGSISPALELKENAVGISPVSKERTSDQRQGGDCAGTENISGQRVAQALRDTGKAFL